MISYEAIKTIHIISSTVLFGTGLGSAFYVWMDRHIAIFISMIIIFGRMVYKPFL